jgi:hypothetical protein
LYTQISFFLFLEIERAQEREREKEKREKPIAFFPSLILSLNVHEE